jgi:CheY-like chemotaxis protein
MKRILVIEDEQLVRCNIIELLEAEGFEPIEAENGHVGITRAWEHKPDLIICDVMMPEMDGYKVLNLLRQEPATALIPFIFLTAKADKTSLRQAMEMGADDYLTKPFTKNELLGAVVARQKKQATLAQQIEQITTALHASTSDRTKNNYASIFANHFTALKLAQFTGRLLVKSAAKQEWTFYVYLGRVLYATGGTHTVRRWQRNLAACCPQIQVEQLNLPAELNAATWEYHLLGLWLKQQQVSREQVAQIVRDNVTEVLFDILLAGQVEISQALSEAPLSWQLILIDIEQTLTTAQQLWQSWQNANLTNFSPNKAPVIKSPESLQQQTSSATYHQLTTLLDGQSTLRDLAVRMKRQILEVTSSLLPYVQKGVVDLVDIPDLQLPQISSAVPSIPTAPAKPTIACIDDSPLVCQSLKHIAIEAGCQFVEVQDPLRAIAILLSHKPDLIFLDLVMPNLNGYEICTQLRKIFAFRDTPIVILSSNLIDRVRAMLAGASDYLEKPVKSEAVLKLISKYLFDEQVTEQNDCRDTVK